MAFSRSFQQETWLVQLPNGDIEVFASAALEKAFRFGLVNGRTPVRPSSSSAQAWTSLAVAAGLEDERTSIPSSLSPSAVEVDASSFKAGSCGDATSFRSRVGRGVAVLISVAAICSVCVSAAVAFRLQPVVETVQAVSAINQATPAERHFTVRDPEVTRDLGSSLERDVRTMERRRAMDDAILRWKEAIKRRHGAGETQSMTHTAGSTTMQLSFLTSGDRFDPLNGNL